VSTGPDVPCGDDEDALAAFASEASPSASGAPDTTAEVSAVGSSPQVEQLDHILVLPAAAASERPTPPPPAVARESAQALVGTPAPQLDVNTRVATTIAVTMGIVGVIIGMMLVEVGRVQRSISTTPSAAVGRIDSPRQLGQPSGTAGRVEGSASAAATPNPVAPSATRRDTSQVRPDDRSGEKPRSLVDSRAHRTVEQAVNRGGTTTSLQLAQPTVASSISLDGLPVMPLPAERASYVPARIGGAPAASARLAEEQVQDVLDSYREYCERLDAASAATLWRGVDTRALGRAFSSLSSQTLAFDRCDIDVSGARASAVCTGSLSYVRRVGDQTPQSRRLSWSFDLEQTADRWMISNVTAR
jgi:hypothetical protein